MNRLETEFGNVNQWTPLRTFIAYYRFDDRTWSIHVWARDWAEADAYCKAHSMENTGELIEEIE